MKKLLMVFIAVMFIVPTLFAQGRGRRQYRYDAAKEKTYAGVIVCAADKQGKRGPRYAVTFKAEAVTYRLSVGPKGWLEGKGISLKAGAAVVVKGVVHTGRRGSTLFARTISLADKTVELRNSEGKPNWPRPRRGQTDGDQD